MHHHFHHFFGGRGGHRHFSFGGGRGGPFGGGGGFRGGVNVRMARMLSSEDLQLIILLLLQQKPHHGYEVIKAIEQHSSGVYTPSPGMVYPALTFLEETGHASAAAEGTKKLFSITPEGVDYLATHRAAADEVWSQLALVGRRMAHFQRQFAEDEDVAEHFGSGASGARAEWQQMKAEFMAVRGELKAAIFQKVGASLEEKRRVLDILRRAIEEIRRKA